MAFRWGCPSNSSRIVIQSRSAKSRGQRVPEKSGDATINRCLKGAISKLLIPRRQFIAGISRVFKAQRRASFSIRRVITCVWEFLSPNSLDTPSTLSDTRRSNREKNNGLFHLPAKELRSYLTWKINPRVWVDGKLYVGEDANCNAMHFA